VVASNFSTSKLYPRKKETKQKASEGQGEKRSPTQCTCKLQYGKVMILLQMEGTITPMSRTIEFFHCLRCHANILPHKRTPNTKRNKVMCMNTLTVSWLKVTKKKNPNYHI
jgi:hypothetical protein